MVYTMINLHLLSTPGDRDIRWVLDACRPYLKDKDEPTVAFLPMASLNVNQWLVYTVREFKGLAQIELIDTERMDLPTMDRFDALNATPFNFLAHYDADAYGQSMVHDDWLSDYHVFHNNPVIMLSDGAYVKVAGKQTSLVRGDAWILRKDAEKVKLEVNVAIPLSSFAL